MSAVKIARRGGALFVLAMVATACGDDPVGTGGEDLSREDAAFLAWHLTGLGGDALDEETAGLAAAAPGADGLAANVMSGPSFLHARSCPAGGSLEIEGEINFNFDGETLEVSFQAVKTMEDCGFERSEQIFIVNGQVEISANRTWVNREPSGLQETHIHGTVTVAVEGTDRVKSCEIDVTAVFDPAAGTREVTGTFCDHDVSQTSRADG